MPVLFSSVLATGVLNMTAINFPPHGLQPAKPPSLENPKPPSLEDPASKDKATSGTTDSDHSASDSMGSQQSRLGMGVDARTGGIQTRHI